MKKEIAYEKVFVILLAACIVVASIATISLASYELLAFGLQHGGSGGRVYEQSYAKVHAINESCTVTDILMTINGVDIGKVADYSNEYYGRISLGGTVGVMLDNIKIE